MRVPVRLAVFTLALGMVFAGAYGAGAIAVPAWSGATADPMAGGHAVSDHGEDRHGTATAGPGGPASTRSRFSTRPGRQ